jgi:hypothetical protein
MHFGIPTFWDPPPDYLYGGNPTYHDCHTTTIDHGPQTEGYYPCLNPNVFNPTDLDAENWMEASALMGMKEIIITAHHEGGFALWPSKHTPYSVAASSWKGGKVRRPSANGENPLSQASSPFIIVYCRVTCSVSLPTRQTSGGSKLATTSTCRMTVT